MASKNLSKLRNTVMLAALTAIVLMLQIAGVTVRIGATNINIGLIPIVFGAIVLGPGAGAWLGLVSGVSTFILLAVMGGDPTFTVILFNNAPIMTALICIVKTTAAGYLAGLVYRVLRKKNSLAALFAAGAVTPIVNTGLFILGGLLISDVLAENFASGLGQTVVYFLVFVVAGINFILEFALNIIVVPALGKIVDVVTRSAYSKK